MQNLNYSIVFNADYYYNKYKDLQQAIGNNADKLLEYFINHGMAEGRQGSVLFDVQYYKNKYQDLQKAFGKDLKQYYLHYINNGYQEKRYGCKLYEKKLTTKYDNLDYSLVYDPLFYVQTYPDLKKAFGYDGEKLIYHFVNNGMKEQRIAKPTFDVHIYQANYQDLTKNFGKSYEKYYLHYINYGFKEHRVADRLVNTQNEYSYKDETGSITIFKEMYNKVNVYAAHLQFTDYTRLKTFFHKSATTSKAAELTGAILCVNGSVCYINGCGDLRDGVLLESSVNKYCTPALYSQKSGKLIAGFNSKYQNMKLAEILKQGIATDSLGFGPPLIQDGVVKAAAGGTKRPRTFAGTNQKAGDIWLVVAEGDGINGNGPGLTHRDCAEYLLSKGCTLAYPFDGGGSSTMVFKGKTLNTPSEKGKERGYLGDFVYFK